MRARAWAVAAALVSAVLVPALWFGPGGSVPTDRREPSAITNEPEGVVAAPGLASVDAALERVIFGHDAALIDASTRAEDGRFLTVLIPYDRTRFFLTEDGPAGYEYELVREYEAYANEHREEGRSPLQAIFLPTPFDQLVPLLASGVGDLAAGGLTVTDERAGVVDFTEPYLEGVRELVAAGPDAEPIDTWRDLAGRRVTVLKGSSYAAHLSELNEGLAAAGLEPVEIVEAESALVTGDLLEMVAAGIFEATVADEHVARLWAQALPDLRLGEVAINERGRIAWAVRPGADDLRDSLNAFLADAKRGTLLGNVLFNRYYRDADPLANPTTDTARAALERYRPLFERHAEEHGFDWRLIAALAWQESGFDPAAANPSGAVGLMQLLPATAAELGYDELEDPEQNVAAGVAYLAFLRDRYFDDPDMPEGAAEQFALAAYNAGPARVARLREAADGMGLDPDRWFFNVERAAQASIGDETVRYVANVQKYLLAYRLSERLLAERETSRERGETVVR